MVVIVYTGLEMLGYKKYSYVVGGLTLLLCCRWVDFINLMSFNFHDAHDNAAELHASLYARPGESGTARNLNVVS